VTFSSISLGQAVLSALWQLPIRVSGLCRGFSFVEMAEVSDVAVAFDLLNNSELHGSRIWIEAEPGLRNGKAHKRDVPR
jgi:RNA recognition motif-containing protein